jgi:glutamine amidotransferase-like uncharacterized protein
MTQALQSNYHIQTFDEGECNPQTLATLDLVAFPGGIGDAMSYDKFFRRKAQNAVADYVSGGGHYLGICMGAYWAGSHFFDILDGIEPVQYIKRRDAEIRRPYSTVATVQWEGRYEDMFFYDGCALIGDNRPEQNFKVISRYYNGDPMAIIQNNVGLIGCHPESQLYWYEKPRQYINNYWHNGRHHDLLLQFTNQLIGD